MSLVLVTGLPGAGKTTALRRVCEALRVQLASGFFTEEVRVRGIRQGFRLVTLDGEGRIIADVRRPGPPRVGKYGVDVAAVDAVARRVLAPDPAVALYVIDEIGRMECLSREFVSAVRSLLALERPLLATVALKGEGLIEEVKRDPRARLLHLTPENRDRIPGEIAGLLATVSLKGEGLTEEVKRDPRARLLHLTPENRHRIPGELAGLLRETLT